MDRKQKAIVYTAISVWLVWVVGLLLYAHFILKV